MLNRREYLLAPIKNQISHPMVLRVETLWGIQNNTSHLAFFIQLYALGMHTFSDKSVIGFSPTPPPFPHGEGWGIDFEKLRWWGISSLGFYKLFCAFPTSKVCIFTRFWEKNITYWDYGGVWQILVLIVKLDANIHKAPQGFYGFLRGRITKNRDPYLLALPGPGVQTLDKYIEYRDIT